MKWIVGVLVLTGTVASAQAPASSGKEVTDLMVKVKELEAKLAQPKLSATEQLEKIQAQYTSALKLVVDQVGPGCKAVGMKLTSITIGADGKSSATCSK